MNLMELIQYSKDLKKRVPRISDWARMEPEFCREVLDTMGFERIHMEPGDLVVRALAFINGLDKAIESEEVLKKARLTARNTRVHNKDLFSDRYKIVAPGVFDVTVIARGKGSRAGFEVFTASNNFCYPVLQSNSAKEIGEYIDNLAA